DDKGEARFVDRRRRALDIGSAGQESEYVALGFVGERLADGCEDARLEPVLGTAAEVPKAERPALALALDERRITEKRAKAGAIERCRHGNEAKIITQALLGVDGERQRKI